jgi:ASC-1-like (ASCH) protein
MIFEQGAMKKSKRKHVEIRTLDKMANNVHAGDVIWDGDALSIKINARSQRRLMESMLKEPIKLAAKENRDREIISPVDEPERFFNNLWRVFHGSYIAASKPKRKQRGDECAQLAAIHFDNLNATTRQRYALVNVAYSIAAQATTELDLPSIR